MAPENIVAIRALDRLYLQAERWPDLAQVLAREAEIAESPDEALELKFRLGQVLQTKLGDVDRALAAYRDVIAAAPEHLATLAALEALFSGGIKQAEVGEILEPLYRSAGEFEKMALVYEAQLAQTQGQEERLAAYYRLAELWEDKLLDTAKALEVYIRALKEFPLDEKSGEEAPRLAGHVDNGWETLANAYADIIGLHADLEVQKAVGRKLARTFEDELGDIGRAEETYKYVLGLDAKDTEALANLDRIYVSLESWPELARTLEMRVQASTDRVDLVELYPRLGEIYETRLNDVPNAIRAYRRVFDELDKSHEGVIAALARIYEAQGAWVELDTVYQRELEDASGDSAEAEIRAKIAHLASEKLGQPDKAIETWKVVLDLRGEDPEALHALADLYSAQSQWAKLVDVLEREFDIATSDDDRANILTRRAQTTSEKLGRDDAAIDDWNRVLDIDFANLAALRAIVGIRRRQGDPNELVAALHQLVDRAAAFVEADELKEVFRELGQYLRQRAAAAVRRGRSVAQAARRRSRLRGDGRARGDLPRRRALDGRHRRQDASRRSAGRAGRQDRRAPQRRGALARTGGNDADGARAAYEKILEIDPAHDEAFAELEKLHTAAGRWEPLIELLPRPPRDARGDGRKDRAAPQDRARVRGEARRQGPGARRARQRARRWTSTIARPRDTSSGWRRRPGAGAR